MSDQKHNNKKEKEEEEKPNFLSRISFRPVTPNDIPECFDIEKASYPEDEAATLTSLQYRQHHAAKFFRCATLLEEEKEDEEEEEEEEDEDNGSIVYNYEDQQQEQQEKKEMITSKTDQHHLHHHTHYREVLLGFICATRCKKFHHETMTTHDPTGNLLAIHSVVVAEPYRRRGIATAMLTDYIRQLALAPPSTTGDTQKTPPPQIDKVVLLAKSHLLAMYVNCGFAVLCPSDIVHRKEQWYHLELDLQRVRKQEQESLQKTLLQQQGHSCSPCWTVDSFTHVAGAGNPAGVVLLPCQPQTTTAAAATTNENTDEKNDNNMKMTTIITRQWMKVVAREFNLSETAFIWPMPMKEEEKSSKQNNDEEGKMIQSTTTSTTATTAEKNDEQKEESPKVLSLRYGIRYYTCNGTEVDLCGHATLASAAVVFSQLNNNSNNIISSVVFHAKADRLEARPDAPIGGGGGNTSNNNNNNTNNNGGGATILSGKKLKIRMDFPQKLVTQLVDQKEQEATNMIQNAFPDRSLNVLGIFLDQDGGDLLVELTEDSFDSIGYENINYSALLEWSGYSRGVIIACTSSDTLYNEDDNHDDDDDEDEDKRSNVTKKKKKNNDNNQNDDEDAVVDFKSRFFGPKAGIDEDPVTGSAHCVLAPYFGRKLSKTNLIASQKSRRGGSIRCVLNNNNNRVILIGSAVMVMSGTLWI